MTINGGIGLNETSPRFHLFCSKFRKVIINPTGNDPTFRKVLMGENVQQERNIGLDTANAEFGEGSTHAHNRRREFGAAGMHDDFC